VECRLEAIWSGDGIKIRKQPSLKSTLEKNVHPMILATSW
jgi:hypothetical protein